MLKKANIIKKIEKIFKKLYSKMEDKVLSVRQLGNMKTLKYKRKLATGELLSSVLS